MLRLCSCVSRDALPQLRVVMLGRRWQYAFEVEVKVTRYADGIGEQLVYDLLPDVREQVLEPVRFDVYAMWSDPRERLGLR